MPRFGTTSIFLCIQLKQSIMKDYSNEIIPMYDDPEAQQDFNQVYNSHYNFTEMATDYFEKAGVDEEDEELIEYFFTDTYPFEEFKEGMPPADKLKYGGNFIESLDYKVFYLNINYANLADRLKAYQLLDRFGIDFYPVHIIDNRHLRSYYIPNAPDPTVQEMMDRIKAKQMPENELKVLMSFKRKQDQQPIAPVTWILNEQEENILTVTDKSWFYFGDHYHFDIRVNPQQK